VLDFDDTSYDYVDCGTGLSLDITEQLTLHVRAFGIDLDYGFLIAKTAESYAAPFANFGLSYNSYQDLDLVAGIGGSSVKLVELATGWSGWKTVTATYDGTWSHMYVDGKLESSSNTYSGALDSEPTWPVTLGAARYAGDNESIHWPGLIDVAAIYNRALTPSEIKQLYEDPYRLITPRRTIAYSTGAAPVTTGQPTMRRWGGIPYMIPGSRLLGRSW